MAFLNAVARVLHVNIAYFGPALSGKLTNLRAIHAATQPEARSEWAFAIEPFPLVAFYFTPLALPPIDGNQLCFHLSAIPGHVFEDEGRKQLLRNVDGVVFVADQQIARLEASLEMMENLAAHLAEQGREAVPTVLQYNKCDLPDRISPEELDELLNPAGWPCNEAAAITGYGVMDTLKAIAKSVILGLRDGTIEQNPLLILKAPTEPLRLWSLFRSDVLGQR